MSAQFHDVFVSILLILCLMGFLLNAITLLVISRLRKSLTPVLLLTLGLAAADLWASTNVAVGLFVNTVLPALNAALLTTEPYHCLVLVCECFKLGAVATSISYLVLLAVCHYLAIVFPVDHSVWMTKRLIKRLMIVVIIIPPVAILAFLRFISHSDPNEGAYQNIGESWNESLTYNDTNNDVNFAAGASEAGICYAILVSGYADFIFRGSVFCVVFLIPFLLLATMYAKMLAELRRTKKAFRRNSMARLNSRRKLQRKRRTVLTTMLMIASFVVGWLPSTLVFLSVSREFDWVRQIFQRVPTAMIAVSGTVNVLMVLKFSANPIIYAMRIPAINLVVKAFLTKWKLIKAKSLERTPARHSC